MAKKIRISLKNLEMSESAHRCPQLIEKGRWGIDHVWANAEQRQPS